MHNFLPLIEPAFIASVLPSDTRHGGVSDYPNKPIHVVASFAAGGPGDRLVPVIKQKLAESWGQQIVIDDRQGINGNVRLQTAARAAPDGYTMVLASGSYYINPSLYRKLPFDPIKDFVPVGLVASVCNILVVHPAVPANSVNELIALAKSKPGQLKYASTGHGSTPHLAGEMFKMMTGVDIVHVPYKGFVAGAAALSEGRDVQLMFDAMITAMPHVRAGELRPLAVAAAKRATILSDIPTMAECGLSGFDVSPVIGLLAPAGTPREIILRFSSETANIMQMPDVKQRLQSDGIEPLGSTPEQHAAYMKGAFEKWAKVIKDTGILTIELAS